MQNDPVNFVDPSGLVPSDGCGADLSFAQCYGNSQWDPFFGGSFGRGNDGWGSDPRPGLGVISGQTTHSEYDPEHDVIRFYTFAPYLELTSDVMMNTWLGFFPQNPGRDEKEVNDCKTFAEMTQTIADLSPNRNEFLDNMARTFTAANDSSIGEMIRTQNMNARMRFGDTGFRPQFQDGYNQVRHFVAGFIAGAIDPTGGAIALSEMNGRENPALNPLDQKDINLNGVSTRFGATYAGSAHGIEFTRRYLARAIRTVVCQ